MKVICIMCKDVAYGTLLQQHISNVLLTKTLTTGPLAHYLVMI